MENVRNIRNIERRKIRESYVTTLDAGGLALYSKFCAYFLFICPFHRHLLYIYCNLQSLLIRKNLCFTYKIYTSLRTGGLHCQLEAKHPLAAIIKGIFYHFMLLISYHRPKSWGGRPTWIYFVFYLTKHLSTKWPKRNFGRRNSIMRKHQQERNWKLQFCHNSNAPGGLLLIYSIFLPPA